MKIEHVYQVMVAEIAFHEIIINGLNAYMAKKMNVSREEIDVFLEQYQNQETMTKYVQSVHRRTMSRIQELEASS